MTAPRNCDLIIKNGCLLTMDERRAIIPRGAMAVAGHTIAAAGPEKDILRDWQSKNVIDAKGAIVHPGYVDAHLHVNAPTCRGFFGWAARQDGGGRPSFSA